VRLEPDAAWPARDAAGRLLRYVRVKGERRTLQEAVLRAGWAKLAAARGDRLARAEALARAARAGRDARPGLRTTCGISVGGPRA
jgi:endonuclease YncB( thermonuclease family)